MDAVKFGEAYPDLPKKATPSNPERRELLEDPRKWMLFFDEQLTAHFTDTQESDDKEILDQLVEYAKWSYGSLGHTARRLSAIKDPSSTGIVESELTFHKLSAPVIPLWYQLLADTSPATPDELTTMQIHLAVDTTMEVQRFRQLSHTNDETEHKRLTDVMGYVSEADTLLVGLEFMKTHPDFIILPAPLKFERNTGAKDVNGSKNSDFITIDTAKKQVRGLQVKTQMDNRRSYLRYDHDFVTMVDTHADLGNTAYDGQKKVALPGQIALSILAERPINDPLNKMPKNYFLRGRAMAREIMRGRKPFTAQATKHVGDRLLHDIYKD